MTNQILVTALPGTAEAAPAFAGSAVRVVEAGLPQTFVDTALSSGVDE